MSRYTTGGTKIATPPTRKVPGGMAGVSLARTNQLIGRQRPAWADDPTLNLPCQQPGEDPDDWFESGCGPMAQMRRERARGLCQGCPMREPCKATGRDNHEVYGIWGGELREPISRPGRALRERLST